MERDDDDDIPLPHNCQQDVQNGLQHSPQYCRTTLNPVTSRP